MAKPGTIVVGDLVHHPQWGKGEHATVLRVGEMISNMGHKGKRYVPTGTAVVVQVDRFFAACEGSPEMDDQWMESGLYVVEAGHACTCMQEMDDRLKPDNLRVPMSIMFGAGTLTGRPFMTTEKIDKTIRGKKPPILVPSYCPFCGVKYPAPKAIVADEPPQESQADV